MARLYSFSCLTQEGVRVSLYRGEAGTVTRHQGHELVLTPPAEVKYDDLLVVVPDGDTRARKGCVVEIAVHDAEAWQIIPRDIRITLQFQDSTTVEISGKPDTGLHAYNMALKSAQPICLSEAKVGAVVWSLVQQRYGRVTLVEGPEKKLASS